VRSVSAARGVATPSRPTPPDATDPTPFDAEASRRGANLGSGPAIPDPKVSSMPPPPPPPQPRDFMENVEFNQLRPSCVRKEEFSICSVPPCIVRPSGTTAKRGKGYLTLPYLNTNPLSPSIMTITS